MLKKNWIWVIFGILGIFLTAFICLIVTTLEDEKKLLTYHYSIGDEMELGGVLFNIYKIDNNNDEIYLLAQENIAITPFYDEKGVRESLVTGYINEFAANLQNKGVVFESVELMHMNDLSPLGFKFYLDLSFSSSDNTPEFINFESGYWIDGECKVENCAYAYHDGVLEAQPYDKEYGVRPAVIIRKIIE